MSVALLPSFPGRVPSKKATGYLAGGRVHLWLGCGVPASGRLVAFGAGEISPALQPMDSLTEVKACDLFREVAGRLEILKSNAGSAERSLRSGYPRHAASHLSGVIATATEVRGYLEQLAELMGDAEAEPFDLEH